jgi:Flp pilus assembly protein protease CpaA
MTVSHLVLLQFLYGSALTDLYDRRIPNAFTGMYLLLGLFLNFRSISCLDMTGSLNLLYSLGFLLTFLISVLILSVLTAMTNAGAGDAKLIALIISWAGFYNGLHILLPGLILALAFILISKAETVFASSSLKKANITPKSFFISKRNIAAFHPPYKQKLNLAFPGLKCLLIDFNFFEICLRLPERGTLPLAIPVFLGAIPGLITTSL